MTRAPTERVGRPDPGAWRRYSLVPPRPRGREGNTDADRRSPQEILGLMLQDERGLRLLRQAIVDGRADVAPRLVDADGQIVHGVLDGNGDVQLDPDGPAVPMTYRCLRYDG